MILKEVGVSAVGSFTYDETKPTPPEYRVHMEWGLQVTQCLE